MNISKSFSSTLTTVIAAAFLLISGCGGGGSGSGAGSVTIPPAATSPPAGAITITAGNAEEEAIAAYAMIQSLNDINDWVGAADATAITIGDIARIIKAMAQKLNGTGGAAGVAWSYMCANNVSAFGDDTIDEGDVTEGRFAGEMDFNGCDDGWGFPIEGIIAYDYSWFANNNYSDHFGGDLTIPSLGSALTGIDYTDNGNYSGNYSFTVTFALSTPVGGYLMQTPTAIAGDFNDTQCALSGEALVTGAADTQLRLTFGGGTAFTVEWSDDGSTWTPVPNTGGFDC